MGYVVPVVTLGRWRMSSISDGVRKDVVDPTPADMVRPYREPRLVSFGSIPGRTFTVGPNGALDGGGGGMMNTSL